MKHFSTKTVAYVCALAVLGVLGGMAIAHNRSSGEIAKLIKSAHALRDAANEAREQLIADRNQNETLQ